MQDPYKPKLYNPRHSERTLLYQTIAEHYETWLDLASSGQFDGQGDHHTPKPCVRQAFRKYLECGIFAHGFARARCGDCGHDYFVAFSCKGRGVCSSCGGACQALVSPAQYCVFEKYRCSPSSKPKYQDPRHPERTLR